MIWISGDALELLLGPKRAQALTPAQTATPPAAAQDPAPAAPAATATDPSRPASLTDFLQLPPAQQFYLTTTPDEFDGLFDTQQQEDAFKAAYNSQTLNIRAVSDVPELDYHVTETFSSTPASSGEDVTMSWNSALAGQEYGPNCFVGGIVGGGAVFVNW